MRSSTPSPLDSSWSPLAGARPPRVAWRHIVVAYALVALAWIFFSDRLLEVLAGSLDEAVWWSTAKGCAFVAVTAGLLYLALRRLAQQVEDGRKTLERSEARFRTLVEAASEGIVLEVGARFAYVNPAAMEILGATSPGQLIGGYVVDRFEPTVWEAVLDRMRAVNEQGCRIGPLEVGVLRLDGGRRRVELSAVPCQVDGEHGAMVLVRDVTDRRAADERLAGQHALLEGILRAVPDALSVKDRDGRYLLVNPVFAAWVGVEAAGLRDRTDEGLFPAELVEQIRSEDRRVLERDGTEVTEQVLPTGLGPRPVQVMRSRLTAPDGRGIGVVMVARDLGERERLESARREAERRFSGFAQRLPGLASIQDGAGRFVWVNPAFEAGFRIPAGGAVGRLPEDILPPAAAETFHVGYGAAVPDPAGPTGEVRLHGGDGLRIHALTWFSLESDPGERRVGCLSLDVTESRHAEASRRALTATLLGALDEERSRWARQLHDTTAQDLTAIGLGLARVLQLLPASERDGPLRDLISDCMGLVEQSGRDVRTFSYLLHPPLLDEVGLPAALREFLDGMSRRSGCRIAFECPAVFERLSRESELALFRVAQEGVAYGGWRGGGEEVRLTLLADAGTVRLEIHGPLAEAGVGSHGGREARGSGLGLSGLRERLRQCGGDLEVLQGEACYTVRARLPAGAAPILLPSP